MGSGHGSQVCGLCSLYSLRVTCHWSGLYCPAKYSVQQINPQPGPALTKTIQCIWGRSRQESSVAGLGSIILVLGVVRAIQIFLSTENISQRCNHPPGPALAGPHGVVGGVTGAKSPAVSRPDSRSSSGWQTVRTILRTRGLSLWFNQVYSLE